MCECIHVDLFYVLYFFVCACVYLCQDPLENEMVRLKGFILLINFDETQPVMLPQDYKV